ncbi:IS3 family transposase [Corynebacterium segmentosum]|uniref:IS3 family transposase n=1 Tax=Corynebacterium segmentosum TaxID=43990 RepID=UPI003B20E9D0
MCHVLKLNRSSFYKWVKTREKRRLKMYSDGLIGARIKTIFDDEHGLYGAKRIAASLKEDPAYTPVNHKKVARIMKAMGLQGFTKRRRCITTRRKPGHRVMPDLVGRKFTAKEDLTPIRWTPDIQPSRAGKKGNLPPCPGTPNSSNAMP